jgi:hypothetical protein
MSIFSPETSTLKFGDASDCAGPRSTCHVQLLEAMLLVVIMIVVFGLVVCNVRIRRRMLERGKLT